MRRPLKVLHTNWEETQDSKEAMKTFRSYISELKDGEPCEHKGCLNHVTHPCENCGRVAGVRK